jgi:hypothetical protein
MKFLKSDPLLFTIRADDIIRTSEFANYAWDRYSLNKELAAAIIRMIEEECRYLKARFLSLRKTSLT